ncbi:MAG: GDP-mannose 4,6-dehydratase [Bacteroidia bacterium]
MKFFITGAAGFIGSNLADKLLANGHNVVAFDNFDSFYHEKIKRQNISEALKSKNYYLIEGDILDNEKLYESLLATFPDIVIHLAAKGGVRPSIENPEAYFQVNVSGTLNLLEAMRNANLKKLIFASSSSVYGNNPKVPFAETDNVDNPISPYAASKKAGELLCHTYHHLHGFDVYCLRFFTVYGPRQRPDLAIHKFFNAILNNQPITIYGDGTTGRDYTYIHDITEGVVSAINKLKGYEIINLGGSQPIILKDLIKRIETTTGIAALINTAEMQQGDVNTTFADIDKARKILGYNPITDINRGLELYYTWLKNQ